MLRPPHLLLFLSVHKLHLGSVTSGCTPAPVSLRFQRVVGEWPGRARGVTRLSQLSCTFLALSEGLSRPGGEGRGERGEGRGEGVDTFTVFLMVPVHLPLGHKAHHLATPPRRLRCLQVYLSTRRGGAERGQRGSGTGGVGRTGCDAPVSAL